MAEYVCMLLLMLGCTILQVTVRKAGLSAVSRLLLELPEQTRVTELWVRAALPMVSCMLWLLDPCLMSS